MNQVIQKTLGGLSKEYYIRQFLFGLIFPAIFYFAFSQSEAASVSLGLITSCIINTLLYPYSRFVYESIVDYILGDTVIFGSILVVMLTKYFTMAICWAAAVLIAPIGLLYLYFHQSKNEN